MSDNIFFTKNQIKARATPKKPVNKSGYVYAGRKYYGSMVEIIILNDVESVS